MNAGRRSLSFQKFIQVMLRGEAVCRPSIHVRDNWGWGNHAERAQPSVDPQQDLRGLRLAAAGDRHHRRVFDPEIRSDERQRSGDYRELPAGHRLRFGMRNATLNYRLVLTKAVLQRVAGEDVDQLRKALTGWATKLAEVESKYAPT